MYVCEYVRMCSRRPVFEYLKNLWVRIEVFMRVILQMQIYTWMSI